MQQGMQGLRRHYARKYAQMYRKRRKKMFRKGAMKKSSKEIRIKVGNKSSKDAGKRNDVVMLLVTRK